MSEMSGEKRAGRINSNFKIVILFVGCIALMGGMTFGIVGLMHWAIEADHKINQALKTLGNANNEQVNVKQASF